MKIFIRAILPVIIVFVFLAVAITGCKRQQTGEELARQYCSSCHIFPEPALLDKRSWEKGALPQMAFRMGFGDLKIALSFSKADREIVLNTLPENPMVSEEEWKLIKTYYLSNAPDSLVLDSHKNDSSLTLFDLEPISIGSIKMPNITMVKTDPLKHKTYIGTRDSILYRFDNKLIVEDSFQLSSPISAVVTSSNGLTMALMGIMDPNDQSKGKISVLNSDMSETIIIDSLKRPVDITEADLNNDKLPDFIVSEFGHYTGALTVFENLGNQKFKKHTLHSHAGTRRVVLYDANGDGIQDIVALVTQGSEQILLLTNMGNFNFRQTTLLQFPPVYGSSYFDLADFNQDGNLDILYTNGDNADYSPILKPYHGVRIFENNGHNVFSEKWFYSMPGASKALSRDFDSDGDLDIAAISYFPDFKRHPEEGFIYFENIGQGFKRHVSKKTMMGRWLVMDAADIDSDGDDDLILGALDFVTGVSMPLIRDWYANKIDLLYLKNTSKN